MIQIASFFWSLVFCISLLHLSSCTGAAEGEAPSDAGNVEEHPCAAINAENLGSEDPPEPHSAHQFPTVSPDDLIEASVEIRIRQVPDHGLRFFALQVNFNGDAWAHGGFQRDPSDGHANWGGLVSGIDYNIEGNELATLDQIQNVEGRTAAVNWSKDTWYRYRVVRGESTTLPAGQYAVLDEDPIEVPHARTMRRWDFIIEEVDTGNEVWRHHLFTAATRMDGFIYWTETGYGITCDDILEVDWRNPSYESLQWGGPRTPEKLVKSLSQSSCPLDKTTDIQAADLQGTWGTTQTYGQPRAEDSCHLQLLYGE